ncbi:hypothetical protein [Bacillus sp. SG-1]|uniref:hypothetical protein n=1 Tax=Bacillus sp. SG-1 TaxID=161544 RepID=UPI00015430BD|nr:hypothetical protein [Bacillus sp. SG-1]EDL66229.1 hypothetical protein BSG1_02715 [Bacillus sp. SG-1]
MRDISKIPFSPDEEIVIATDNSGGIGTKEADYVYAEDSLTAYFSTRVALMEVLSVKAVTFSVLLHNFSGDDKWTSYKEGIQTALQEAGISKISISGSSESNFPLKQSALGITVLGKRSVGKIPESSKDKLCYAVIGEPLVGKQVLERKERVAPLALFSQCCQSQFIFDIIPVGSKGILEELKIISGNRTLSENEVKCKLNLTASGGPSTCFIIKFTREDSHSVEELTGSFYHPLLIVD